MEKYSLEISQECAASYYYPAYATAMASLQRIETLNGYDAMVFISEA
jgi:hypothetical protein